MEICKLNADNLDEIVAKAVNVLKNGGFIIYPTETCYGIGADATNQEAVNKLYDYKGFRGQKPFSMAVKDRKMAEKYVEINDIADNLYKNYLPGPVTVVSNSKGGVAVGVETPWKTIGIRIPDHVIPIAIVTAYGKPITATSANVSYKPIAYSIESLLAHTPKKSQKYLNLIIDAGDLPKNVPSTVLDTTLNSLTVLRQGKDEFKNAIKKSNLVVTKVTNSTDETIQMGKEVANKFVPIHDNGPLVFALSGELGAGKTQFTKGIGEYLMVEDIVNSPTYTIINEYKGSTVELAFIHMDTWRIANHGEFMRSGLQQYLATSEIVVVEWADKYYKELEELVSEFGGKIVKVDFKYLDQNTREISVYENR
ncbi:threonylcarbamoyl-AMP synthase [bacterium]|nr:threonylcarbamoyl-AMP synthase [bacterium]